jgi:hypothetical protein
MIPFFFVRVIPFTAYEILVLVRSRGISYNGTKANIFEQTAAHQNNTRMEETLMYQGFIPL